MRNGSIEQARWTTHRNERKGRYVRETGPTEALRVGFGFSSQRRVQQLANGCQYGLPSKSSAELDTYIDSPDLDPWTVPAGACEQIISRQLWDVPTEELLVEWEDASVVETGLQGRMDVEQVRIHSDPSDRDARERFDKLAVAKAVVTLRMIAINAVLLRRGER